MRTYNMNARQLCFIFIAFIPLTKIINMPSIISHYSSHSAWLSVVINFIIDFALLMFFLWTYKRFGGESLYEIISRNTCKVFADIIFILYAVYFFLKAYFPITEQKEFVEYTLYETAPALATFLPFFLFCAYISTKGFKSLARSAEIMIWFTIFGMLCIFFLSYSSVEFSEILPLSGVKFTKIAEGSFKTSSFFMDSLYFLFFMGGFKDKKKSFMKITLSFLSISLAVVIFIIFFTGIYGSIAERQFFAPTKMAKYNIALSNIGRIDYIASFILTASAIFSVSIPIMMCCYCLTTVIKPKIRYIIPIIVNALMLVIIFILDRYYGSVVLIIFGIVSYFFIFMACILPFILLFMKPKGRQNEIS